MPVLLGTARQRRRTRRTTVLDTFTAANGTTLAARVPDYNGAGAAWSVLTGGFDIQSNEANSTGVGLSQAVIESQRALAVVKATVKIATGGFVGLYVRVTDTSNGWYVLLRDDTSLFTLVERNAGVDTVRASTAFNPTPGTPALIVVTMQGQTIKATLDGANEISYTSASFNQSATKHGLVANLAANRADSFTVITP